jgi:hypothetical protein
MLRAAAPYNDSTLAPAIPQPYATAATAAMASSAGRTQAG